MFVSSKRPLDTQNVLTASIRTGNRGKEEQKTKPNDKEVSVSAHTGAALGGDAPLKNYRFTIEQLIQFFDEMDKGLQRLNEKAKKFLEDMK